MPTTESPNQESEKSNLTPEQIDTLSDAPDTFEKNKELLKTLLTEVDYNLIANEIENKKLDKKENASTEIGKPKVEDIPFESI